MNRLRRSPPPRWGRRAIAVVLGLVAIGGMASAAAYGDTTPRPQTASAPGPDRLAPDNGPGCSTTMLKNNRPWQLDTYQVGLSCWSNTSDKTVYIRGVLDVPGALDGHTPWVEIRPNTQLTIPAKQVVSYDTTSPLGTPSTRLEEYQCPPVVIGKCSPFNDNNSVVLAFADLLTNLF
jgi:hypothetical protein